MDTTDSTVRSTSGDAIARPSRAWPLWVSGLLAAAGGPALAAAVAFLLAPTSTGPLTLGGEDASRGPQLCTPLVASQDFHDSQTVLEPTPGRIIRIDQITLLEARDLQLVEAGLLSEQPQPDGSLHLPGTGPGWPPPSTDLTPALGAQVGSGAQRRALVLRLRPTGPQPGYSGVRVDYTWEGRQRYAVFGFELTLRPRCT